MATTTLPGSFVSIATDSIQSSKSSVQQLIDIVQSDIASSDDSTRKKYEVFTSGGLGLTPITSSLYHTVFDQDFSLGTANPLFDVTVGSLLEESTDDQGVVSYSVNDLAATKDSGGKLNFSNAATNPMMREKVNIYRQFAQTLLGDANSKFFTDQDGVISQTEATDYDNSTSDRTSGNKSKIIKGALFICFRRLFTRDNIKNNTLGFRIHKRAANLASEFRYASDAAYPNGDTHRQSGLEIVNINTQPDLNQVDSNALTIIADTGSTISVSPVSGEIGTLLTNDNSNSVGTIFYDSGILVLDIERLFDPDQSIRGEIFSTRAGDSTLDTTGPYAIFGRKTVGGNLENESANKWYYPVYTADATPSSRVQETQFMLVKNDAAETDDDNADFSFYYDDSVPSATDGTDTFPDNYLYPIWNLDNLDKVQSYYTDFEQDDGVTLHNGKLYPSLWTSGTIDDVLDHVCNVRFGNGDLSAFSFRNETIINSSLIFCRANSNQLNYSTNPTYTNSDGSIIAKDSQGNTFTFVTTVGLHDSDGSLLAVAKTSRPIEKNNETELSIRIRLDY